MPYIPNPDRAAVSSIQIGEIIAVDSERWTLSLRAELTKEKYMDVPIPSTYSHHAEGEGIHFMPEVGARCLFTRSKDSVVPLVFVPPASTGGYAGNRPALNPGDLALLTRDQNGIRIRRGGMIEILASPTCYTAYIPADDSIFSFAENRHTYAPGGEIQWLSERPEEVPTGRTPTRLFIDLKEYAEDLAASITAEIGHIPGEIRIDGGQKILNLETKFAGVPTSSVTAYPKGAWDIKVPGGLVGKVSVTSTLFPLPTQPVLLGKDFLIDISAALSAISAALPPATAVLGPIIAKLQAQITLGIGTYVSTSLESS